MYNLYRVEVAFRIVRAQRQELFIERRVLLAHRSGSREFEQSPWVEIGGIPGVIHFV